MDSKSIPAQGPSEIERAYQAGPIGLTRDDAIKIHDRILRDAASQSTIASAYQILMSGAPKDSRDREILKFFEFHLEVQALADDDPRDPALLQLRKDMRRFDRKVKQDYREARRRERVRASLDRL